MKKPTTDSDGRYNGYLVEIWNELERPDLRPSQVYLTAVAPHSRKGPHLHMKRRGLFVCVRETVEISIRYWRVDEIETTLPGATFRTFKPGDRHSYYKVKSISVGDEPIEVPAGIAAAIYNGGDEEALVLNMPAPAWSKAEPDDWPVEGWQDPEDWNAFRLPKAA